LWKEVIDKGDDQSQPIFQYQEEQRPKYAHPENVQLVAYLFFFTAFVTDMDRYAQHFLQTHSNLSVGARADGGKNVSLGKRKCSITFPSNMNII
jgi:hypothetical protein